MTRKVCAEHEERARVSERAAVQEDEGAYPDHEEMYQKILKKEVTAGEIIGKAASVVEPVGAVHIDKKPDVAKADDVAGDDTPEASINIEADIAERMKQEVDAEAKAAKDAGTAEGLSRGMRRLPT